MNNQIPSFNPENNDMVLVLVPMMVSRSSLQAPVMPPPVVQTPAPIPQKELEEGHFAIYDAACAKAGEDAKPRKGLASAKQTEFVRKIARQHDITESEICEKYAIGNLRQLTNAQANDFITKYKDM